MIRLIRAAIVFVAAVATYFLAFWLVMSFVPGIDEMPWLRPLGSLLLAAGVGAYVWKRTASSFAGLATYATLGAVIVGAIGFVIGFFGPLIWAPEANQGPLLGIFITGPLGFLAGGLGGIILWVAQARNRPSR